MMRPWREVVDSLVRRDQTDPASGALLYVAYGLQAAKAEATGASFVTYRQLIQDWRAATERLATEQQFAWPDPERGRRTDRGVPQPSTRAPDIAAFRAVAGDGPTSWPTGTNAPLPGIRYLHWRGRTSKRRWRTLGPSLLPCSPIANACCVTRRARVTPRCRSAIPSSGSISRRKSACDRRRPIISIWTKAFAQRNEEYVAALARADDARTRKFDRRDRAT